MRNPIFKRQPLAKLDSKLPYRLSEYTGLIELICGRPHLVSIRQQLLNWTTFSATLICIFFSFLNSLLGFSLILGIISLFTCFGIYVVIRFGAGYGKPIGPAILLLYHILLAAVWFAFDGINGIVPHLAILAFITSWGFSVGIVRLTSMVGVIVLVIVLTIFSTYYPAWIAPYPTAQSRQLHILLTHYVNTIFCVGFMGVLIHNLNVRQKQADQVLYNILPTSVAKTLKAKPEHSVAHYFENVSVLFADIVDFTPMSATMSPVELISLLNELFSDFDVLVEKYEVEKIKTIGDCYMIAAGAPLPKQDHAHILAQIALDMQQLVQQKWYCGNELQIRIGINTGSVIAGVIGKNKCIYDLWGDAVNTASRMESHGTGGVIQITRDTYELIYQQFLCVPMGKINIKGRGMTEVWHLLESRTQTNGDPGSVTYATSMLY